jgi:hypothetical protein
VQEANASGQLLTGKGAFCMEYFKNFITRKYGMKVIFGTHPIPQKYYVTHVELKSWESKFLSDAIRLTLTDELERFRYD